MAITVGVILVKALSSFHDKNGALDFKTASIRINIANVIPITFPWDSSVIVRYNNFILRKGKIKNYAFPFV